MKDSKKKVAPKKIYWLPNTIVTKELHDAAIAKSQNTGIRLAHIIRKAVEEWVREDGDGAKK